MSDIDYCEDFIEKCATTLPELCSTSDLIKVGIFSSDQTAAIARRKGATPPYFHMPSRNIVYPRAGVIAYLRKYKCV